MIIKALVAVRSGSKRVENKNIRPFAGSSLLEIKLSQLMRIPSLNGIIVNSNSDDMLSIALKYGCEAVKRDQYYANDTVLMSDVYKHIAENCKCDVIVYANATNPLLKDATLVKAIEFFKEKMKQYDSLNSAHLIKEFLFKKNLPINYNLKEQPRSQDLPDIYALNFAVNIITRTTMIECKNVVGYKPYIYDIEEIESIDIDNMLDFDFAEFIFNKQLKSNFE